MLTHLTQSLFVMLLLILATIWLKRRDKISDEHAPGFTNLVMDLLLPGVIFATLSRADLEPSLLIPGVVMLGALLGCLAIAWAVGHLFRFESPQLGSLILVAGFGSSASLGLALIAHIFPGDSTAMVEAVVMTAIGAIFPVFLIGIPIAVVFGTGQTGRTAHRSGLGVVWKELRAFLVSPLFVALLLGTAASFFELPDNIIVKTVYQFTDALQGALPFVVALTIGLMLRPVALVKIGAALAAVVLIKLIMNPWVAATLGRLDGMGQVALEVLVIEAAMPSGAIAALVAARYGCDAALASAIVVITYALSLVAVPLATYLLV